MYRGIQEAHAAHKCELLIIFEDAAQRVCKLHGQKCSPWCIYHSLGRFLQELLVDILQNTLTL